MSKNKEGCSVAIGAGVVVFLIALIKDSFGLALLGGLGAMIIFFFVMKDE